MTSSQNAIVLIVIILVFVGAIAIKSFPKHKQPQVTATSTPAVEQSSTTPALERASSTPAIPNTGPDIATTTAPAQSFSPTNVAAKKVEDTSKTFVNQSAPSVLATPSAPAEFFYIFNVPETFEESDSLIDSPSKYWWLDSGAKLISTGEYGETIQGALPADDPWRIDYADSNPVDTDKGEHPQNLFRLVSKTTWNDVREEFFFRITADNLSASPNRNESNGILLMSHYQDHGATLYYAGLRVDGTAVIKKKFNGIYYTLAQTPILPGTYSRIGQPDLLPHNQWIGLRTETTTNKDGSIAIALYMGDSAGDWIKVLSAVDNGVQYANTPTIPAGLIGIRTDFMDVQFQNFHAQSI